MDCPDNSRRFTVQFLTETLRATVMHDRNRRHLNCYLSVGQRMLAAGALCGTIADILLTVALIVALRQIRTGFEQ